MSPLIHPPNYAPVTLRHRLDSVAKWLIVLLLLLLYLNRHGWAQNSGGGNTYDANGNLKVNINPQSGSGNLFGIIACDNHAAVNINTATTTQIIAISGTGGRTYICAIDLVTAGANNVALVSGSGTNCASNLAGLAGGTTAATGWNFAANGGLTKGTGLGMIWKTVTTNNEICLVTSAAVQLSGSITYTQF